MGNVVTEAEDEVRGVRQVDTEDSLMEVVVFGSSDLHRMRIRPNHKGMGLGIRILNLICGSKGKEILGGVAKQTIYNQLLVTHKVTSEEGMVAGAVPHLIKKLKLLVEIGYKPT